MNGEKNNIPAFHLYALVMAGGAGTRFWPESTSKRPKQYLNLVSEKSLLQETLLRFDGVVDRDRRFIVTVKEQEAWARNCAGKEIGKEGIIFEPAGRNTAPCIFLSLIKLLKMGASARDVVAIVPADHVILNKRGFAEVVRDATIVAAAQRKIVTIGIPPNFPHTGYGYIQKGEAIEGGGVLVKSFKEKPDYATAKEYLASGDYFWNAGMFVASIEVLLSEFKKNAPYIYKFYEELFAILDDFIKLTSVYGQIISESIDYAIMEKSSEVVAIPARFDWNDLGSWDALEAVVASQEGNIIVK